MYIVTGGAGFIGSNIVKKLNDKGIDNILIVDNLANTQKYMNLNKLRFHDYVDKTDFLNRLKGFRKIDAIFHQGACSATTELDANYLIRNNYEYSKELLHFSMENEIPFLYASSASVYGNGENGFTEDPSCEYPLNGYAFSKFIFDNYVRRIITKGGLKNQILGLRYFNVYGYQENHKGSMASVPFHFYNQAKENGEIKIFEGSEKFLRDFIFVEDVVKVVMHFLETGKSGIYNCGTGQERSFMDMANSFVKIYGDCKITTIPFPEHLKGKYQVFTKADTANLKASGYSEAFDSLERGMTKYLNQLSVTNGLF